MTDSRATVHIAVTCTACNSKNELTLSIGLEDEGVSCSHCGAKLGRVASLADAAKETGGESLAVNPRRQRPLPLSGQRS